MLVSLSASGECAERKLVAIRLPIGQQPEQYQPEVAPDGMDYRPLIPREQGISSMPDWSPDGTRLVFSGGRLAHRTIRVVNRDGTGLTPLTQQSRGDDTWPHWSPDGNLIVFSRTRPKTQRSSLYTMNTDGSDVRRLTGTNGDDIVDDWQPLSPVVRPLDGGSPARLPGRP